jgi:hypothetical protein
MASLYNDGSVNRQWLCFALLLGGSVLEPIRAFQPSGLLNDVVDVSAGLIRAGNTSA